MPLLNTVFSVDKQKAGCWKDLHSKGMLNIANNFNEEWSFIMVYAIQVLSSTYSPILGYSICMVFSQRLMIIFLVQQRKIFEIDHNKQQSERRLFGFCSFFVRWWEDQGVARSTIAQFFDGNVRPNLDNPLRFWSRIASNFRWHNPISFPLPTKREGLLWKSRLSNTCRSSLKTFSGCYQLQETTWFLPILWVRGERLRHPKAFN